MKTIEPNSPVPDIELPATGGRTIRLSDFKGKNLVLYFYPKDNTPGCTREGQDFRDQYARFRRRDTAVLGVSRDDLRSHEKFRCEQAFPFDLVSDADERLCTLFGVIKLKNMYGKRVRGIERSTFLIDSDSIVRREWRGVKLEGHVEQVLEAVKELKKMTED